MPWTIAGGTALNTDLDAAAPGDEVAGTDRTRLQLELLARASEVLTGSLALETTMDSVARLLVPQLADICLIDVVGDGGAARRLGAIHRNPSKEPLLRELGRLYPAGRESSQPAGVVLRSGRPLLLENIDAEVIRRHAIDERNAQLVIELDFRSAVVIPMIAGARTLGVLTLLRTTPHAYSAADVPFAELVAGRCALAVDNALLYERARAALQEKESLVEDLQLLADAALKIGAADSLEETVDVISEQARRILGARSVITGTTGSDRAGPGKGPGARDLLTAPLTDRAGRHLGTIEVSDKIDGDFTAADRAVLVQLARLASVALESARLQDDMQTAVRETQRALAQLDILFESAPVGIAFIDHEGRFVRVNETLAQIDGVDVSGHIGRRPDDVIEGVGETYRSLVREVLETGRPIHGRELSGRIRGNAEGHWIVSFYPVGKGILSMGIGMIVVDITQRKRQEEERASLLLSEQDARTRAEAAMQRLRDLQSVTEAALSHLALDDLLQELTDRLTRVLELDVAAILLLDEERSNVVVRAAVGLDHHLPVGESLPLQVVGGAAIGTYGTSRPSATGRHPLDRLFEAAGVSALLSVPLTVGNRVTGELHIGSYGERVLGEDEVQFLRLIADRAALAIDHASLYEHEHHVAETLQLSLLPGRLPAIPGVAVAARYLPGGPGVMVGGDWYDILQLPDGKVGVVIGDVVGRGVRAASVMGQLRNALRAYAFEGYGPGAVMQRLDRLIEGIDQPVMATVVHLMFDPRTGDIVFANAGHPPPLIVDTEGSPRYLSEPSSVPLGVMADSHHREGHSSLAPGSRLLLYTDGLIERRTESLDVGLERLARSLAAASPDVESACEDIVRMMFGTTDPADDVAFVLLRSMPLVDGLELRLPATNTTVTTLRHSLQVWLSELGVSEPEAFDVLVAAGEAVSNAVEHAYGPEDEEIEVAASYRNGVVEVIVRDHGSWRPPRNNDRGRGLKIIEELMDESSIDRGPEGTTVAMRLRVPMDG